MVAEDKQDVAITQPFHIEAEVLALRSTVTEGTSCFIMELKRSDWLSKYNVDNEGTSTDWVH